MSGFGVDFSAGFEVGCQDFTKKLKVQRRPKFISSEFPGEKIYK